MSNKAVRKYVDEKVKPDAEESRIKREMATGVVQQLREVIPNAGNPQYSGSNYEKNATRDHSDFDVMVPVAPKGSKFQVEGTDKSNIHKLKYQSGADSGYVDKYVTSEGHLSGRAVLEKQVQSPVDKAIGIQNHGGHLNVNGRDVEIKRSVGGTAVTLDLKSGKHETQVDIVPTVTSSHVVGGKQGVDYVAKPAKSQPDSGTWRESHSMQEKEKFTGIDQGNQVHRETLQVTKTIIKEDPQLQGMTSHIAKTAALNLIDKDEQRKSQGAQAKSWGRDDTADRLADMGKEIYKGLDRGEMSRPSNRATNVLGGVSEEQRMQWKKAIGPDGQGLVEKASGSKQN